MADSIQDIMSNDEMLEDFAEAMHGREPDVIGKITQLTKDVAPRTLGSPKGMSLPGPLPHKHEQYNNLSERMAKLESQIGRILLHLKIARPDEIIVTSEMPETNIHQKAA